MKEDRLILDVDGVCANFVQALIEKAKELGLENDFPKSWLEITQWFFSPKIGEVWRVIEKDLDFWLNIKPIPNSAKALKMIPYAYLTARPIPSTATLYWLARNKFPYAKVHTVKPTASKAHLLRHLRATILVDDKPENCDEAKSVGVKPLLFDAPHNQKVHHLDRIYSLSEVK